MQFLLEMLGRYERENVTKYDYLYTELYYINGDQII